jgi:hypothetical protein
MEFWRLFREMVESLYVADTGYTKYTREELAQWARDNGLFPEGGATIEELQTAAKRVGARLQAREN